MNLIIDVGNTLVKFAVFQQNRLIDKQVVTSKEFLKEFNLITKKHKELRKSIISSVGKISETDINYVQKKLNTLILNSKLKFPFENLYATPNTLGVDRIALVCASVAQFPKNNVLIIDAGTCITYDFINAKNEYIGGAISPGIRLRYQSLHNLTANLPLLETKMAENIIGNSTSESIHSGVIYGVLKEIKGIQEDYGDKYSDLTVILTGGDANFLSKQLKNGIFANSNFLLEGLNFILEYNS